MCRPLSGFLIKTHIGNRIGYPSRWVAKEVREERHQRCVKAPPL
jgi:hypothetical protein